MTLSADTYEAALQAVEAANQDDVPLKLLGGQAVRYLTPDFPPRVRSGQDMDFASVSTAKKPVMDLLGELGFEGDRRFNTMHGHRQMYFVSPASGPAVDVIMDQLQMCHVLEFKDRITRMPFTLDVTDLLLTKLQVVEQNEKDVQDIVYLLSAYEVREGDEPGTIGLDRVVELVRGDLARIVPSNAAFDPVEHARALRRHADTVPKSLRWKIRSRVGERVQWYELPEEVAH